MHNLKCHQYLLHSTVHLSVFTFPVEENYINLARSNSSGNPSVSSVITGLRKQKNPFCLNGWVSWDRLVRLCLWRAFEMFSQFLSLWKLKKVDASHLRAKEQLTQCEWLCVFGPSSWFFGKPRWVPLLSQVTFTMKLKLSQFFTRMRSRAEIS